MVLRYINYIKYKTFGGGAMNDVFIPLKVTLMVIGIVYNAQVIVKILKTLIGLESIRYSWRGYIKERMYL